MPTQERLLSWYFTPQCFCDGWWSNMHQIIPQLNAARALSHSSGRFVLALPDLYYVWQQTAGGVSKCVGPVRFDTVFDPKAIETEFGVKTAAATDFVGDVCTERDERSCDGPDAKREKPTVVNIRVQDSGGKGCNKADIFIPKNLMLHHHQGLVGEKKVPSSNWTHGMGSLLAAGGMTRYVVVNPPGQGRLDSGDLVHFGDASKLTPGFQSTLRALRASEPVVRASEAVMGQFGLTGSRNWAAIHIRAGNIQSHNGAQARLVADEELLSALARAKALRASAGTCLKGGKLTDLVISTVAGAVLAQAERFARLFPKLRVHVFNRTVWHAVDSSGLPGWNPREQLLRDATEVDLWMQAPVFIGTESSMSTVTMSRRFTQRGAADMCNVHAQQCFVNNASYWLAAPEQRLACL